MLSVRQECGIKFKFFKQRLCICFLGKCWFVLALHFILFILENIFIEYFCEEFQMRILLFHVVFRPHNYIAFFDFYDLREKFKIKDKRRRGVFSPYIAPPTDKH